jgi:hypothetical protein
MFGAFNYGEFIRGLQELGQRYREARDAERIQEDIVYGVSYRQSSVCSFLFSLYLP